MIIENKNFKYTFSSDEYKFQLNGDIVEVVIDIKYLGVIIDNNLKFSTFDYI